ncbi:hypothetical protein AMTRI_Chr05g59500 [Amborella trichopoda]
MNGVAEETVYEICIVVPKRSFDEDNNGDNLGVARLIKELEKLGLQVECFHGISEVFIKLAARQDIIAKAAAELQIKKPTYIGMDLQFESDQAAAFVRQPDGTLFSWSERFCCYNHLIYAVENKTGATVKLMTNTKEFEWRTGESLLKRMEAEGIVKQVFPLHDEKRRKQLVRNWALNWLDFTSQPIDEVYSYFGTKIATYFAFLGMYTQWLFAPAAFGLVLQLWDFGSWQLFALPFFFIFVISWAVLLFQFWKRKNSALLTRWHISRSNDSMSLEPGYKKSSDSEFSSFMESHVELEKTIWTEKPKGMAKAFSSDEWLGNFRKFRNNAIVIMGIVCLQLPFELAYAHFYEVMDSDIMKFGLTALYLFAIQYYTRLGGKVSVCLIKNEDNKSRESSADSLVYKVFGLYFMQSYIGLFYHALRHRNFMTLRQFLIQRLIVSQVLENLVENSIPYLKYSCTKFRASRKRKHEKGSSEGKPMLPVTRVEKEYMKPTYSASIGDEVEDGLFDDFLELALQFGMIMMFACAFPLAFSFAALNNITEIRTDALKLLAMLRRPVPRAASTIGAWLNIFQFLIMMSICTNCALLVCLYDQEGTWKIEPGLAAILIMEHILLLIKFGFSRVVPEEPAWVKANRVKHAQVQEMCSKQLLRNICNSPEKKRE